uniref:Glycosyltransferase 61 catalytic domain-containing protein n=1 Tax=Auxenochlorella protothecoides TaxID=3075 RepID=A0A1D1ZZ55_AUXPR
MPSTPPEAPKMAWLARALRWALSVMLSTLASIPKTYRVSAGLAMLAILGVRLGLPQHLSHSGAPGMDGPFPIGCRWRDAQSQQNAGLRFWDVRRYEWWDGKAWTPDMPKACLERGVDAAAWSWPGGTPRTEVSCQDMQCTYQNLWYNNGRFYILVDGPNTVDPWKMSKNHHLQTLHVLDALAFVQSVQARVLPGNTLFMDFPYFLHPMAIGHWPEVLFPAFSSLQLQPGFRPARVLLMSLKRTHLMAWARTFMGVALSGTQPTDDLAPIVFQSESDSVWHQILSSLEGLEESEWLCISKLLVPLEMDLDGRRTFFSQADGHLFRQRLYAQFGLKPPTPHSRHAVPNITLHRKTSNRRILNLEELVAMLRTLGHVNMVEHSNDTPMAEQMRSVASTSVLVSVHTSALAIAPMLRPGSIVVELLQRNWRYQHLDESFKAQTEVMGDIHHFAWRATQPNQTVYLNPRDAVRFGNWTTEMCDTEECVEAHTTVDVVVDVEAVRQLLTDRLALIQAGASVEEASLPWPQR